MQDKAANNLTTFSLAVFYHVRKIPIVYSYQFIATVKFINPTATISSENHRIYESRE